ncbi:dehydratase [Vibrio sp. 10N.286.49.B3]|uniref:MaoC family dehydratase n=1 Tax=Vibrio sp. 10N.286.49.B3 TaxID=1880855 RepID=UPI000C82D696|nr:MaoC family dehydratase [Vibrio sp. 10N.286.49.B3]PMH43265.1 dehydratase [Vibrio sp. 10N.286.49.B3]
MKVTNPFKHLSQSSIVSQQNEPMHWMTPSLRGYWGELMAKTQGKTIFPRMRDLQAPVVEKEAAPVQPVIVLKPEAQALYEELQFQVGEVMHIGDWLSVDQERIDKFAEVTQDMQWIHTDPERAEAESPFKTTIAHGFLTLALLPKLTDSVDPENPLFPTAKMVVNLGLNKVRFPYPVKSGCNLRAKSTLLKVTPIKKGLEIEREIRIEIEGIRRPGCIAVSVIQLHF